MSKGHLAHGGASSSLCVCAKNRPISVCGEQYSNRSQTAQCRFAVPSTHMRIWFANHSAHSCIRGYTYAKFNFRRGWKEEGKRTKWTKRYKFLSNSKNLVKIQEYIRKNFGKYLANIGKEVRRKISMNFPDNL